MTMFYRLTYKSGMDMGMTEVEARKLAESEVEAESKEALKNYKEASK